MTWWDLKTKALHIQFGMCLTKLQKIICHYKMSFFEIAKCIFPSQRKWWVIDPCQGLKAKVSILIQLVPKCRWDFQRKLPKPPSSEYQKILGQRPFHENAMKYWESGLLCISSKLMEHNILYIHQKCQCQHFDKNKNVSYNIESDVC